MGSACSASGQPAVLAPLPEQANHEMSPQVIVAKKASREKRLSFIEDSQSLVAESASSLEERADVDTLATGVVSGGMLSGALVSEAANGIAIDAAGSSGALNEVAKVTSAVGKATGATLLEMAKGVPMIAPIAYLLAAVASSASQAVNLKADCMELGKVCRTVEAILIKAESLEQHEAVIGDVMDSLQDALPMMNAIQDRGALLPCVFANADKTRFEDVKARIESAIARMNLGLTTEMAQLQRTKFEQSEKLKLSVYEMGGAANVVNNPEKMAQIEAQMTASDQVLNENVTAARAEVREVGNDVNDVKTEVKKTNELQRRNSQLITDTHSLNVSQNEKMDRMMEQFQEPNPNHNPNPNPNHNPDPNPNPNPNPNFRT